MVVVSNSGYVTLLMDIVAGCLKELIIADDTAAKIAKIVELGFHVGQRSPFRLLYFDGALLRRNCH